MTEAVQVRHGGHLPPLVGPEASLRKGKEDCCVWGRREEPVLLLESVQWRGLDLRTLS